MAPLTLIDYSEQDVIMEVLTDSGEVHDCSYVDAREKGRVADARDLENLGRMNCPCCKNNLLLGTDCLTGTVSACGKLWYHWSARRTHSRHVDTLPLHLWP
jgi:hypothetical protein